MLLMRNLLAQEEVQLKEVLCIFLEEEVDQDFRFGQPKQ
jgi:hypothetical protein